MVYDTIMVPFLCCIGVVPLANGFFKYATGVKIQWLQDSREDKKQKIKVWHLRQHKCYKLSSSTNILPLVVIRNTIFGAAGSHSNQASILSVVCKVLHTTSCIIHRDGIIYSIHMIVHSSRWISLTAASPLRYGART